MDGSTTDHSPSPQDVLFLKKALIEARHLPLELVDTIIDYAEYWPRTTTTRDNRVYVRAGSGAEDKFLLRSYPLGFIPHEDQGLAYQMIDQYQSPFSCLEPKPWSNEREVPQNSTAEVLAVWKKQSKPRSQHPCRKIVFTITSRDQGWGGEDLPGVYEGSYTWFDVGKETVSAFTEMAPLEAWQKAPWPQFRLYQSNIDHSSLSGEEEPLWANSKLVCSLRSIIPESIPVPENQRPWIAFSDDEDDAFPESDPEFHDVETNPEHDGGGGLVGPPDDLNPGVQVPAESSSATRPKTRARKQDYTFKHAGIPGDETLQRNVRANHEAKTHTITWAYDDDIDSTSFEAAALDESGRGRDTANGEFVRNMRMGDSVTLWGHARFGGWENQIQDAKIDVYWAV